MTCEPGGSSESRLTVEPRGAETSGVRKRANGRTRSGAGGGALHSHPDHCEDPGGSMTRNEIPSPTAELRPILACMVQTFDGVTGQICRSH